MSTTISAQPPKLILAKQPVSFTAHTSDAGTPLWIKANISGQTDADSVATDGSGNATFELSDYLQGLNTTRFKTQATPSKYASVPYPVQVEFRSLVGAPPVVGSEVVSDVFFLIDGYIPKSRRKTIYSSYSNLLAYLAASKSCLTWWPAAEPVSILPTQRQFLNFIQLYSDAPIDITLDLRLYFTNGSNSGRGAQFTVNAVPKFGVVYFPVDYISLGIEALAAEYLPGLILSHYVVGIHTGPPNMSIPISENYTYVPDFNYYDHARILYIRNAFGMLEILRCSGQGEQVNSLKIETVRTDGRILPEKVNWKLEKTDKVKVDTGFLTAAQMQWLSDMDFLEAYEQIGNVLQPIVFTDMDLPVVHDGVYQYSASLEFEYSYEEKTEVG